MHQPNLMHQPHTTISILVETSPAANPSNNQDTAHAASRTFSRHLSHFWNEVARFKNAGVIKSEDDNYFIAYRSAEQSVRELCDENAKLQADLSRHKNEIEILLAQLAQLPIIPGIPKNA